jgi:4-hydroxy-tetrahydrodipicolinate synthase
MTTALLHSGVHWVMATPFLPDESLDEAGLESLLDDAAASGCQGVLILGVMGEADRLSDTERQRVVECCLDHAGSRLQISVGVTAGSTVLAIERARAAERAGAAAAMVSPPIGSSAGPALREHFRRIAEAISIPLIVQDHPASSGVKLPIEFITGLADVLPPGSVLKEEDPPTPARIAAISRASAALQIFGGLGGVSLLNELEAGSTGTMTGFAFPAAMVEIVSAYEAGDRERAWRRFESILLLMLFEAQPGIGLGLRKEILRRRGVIAHATVRQPAPPPDAHSLRQLDDLLARIPADMRAAASAAATAS